MTIHFRFRLPLATLLFILTILTTVRPSLAPAQEADTTRPVAVRIVTDEADAVLAILARRTASLPIDSSDWRRLFSCEGYRRLKAREQSMRRRFEDEDFKRFVMADTLLARAAALSETVDRWKHAAVDDAGRKALAYLPEGTRIRATIYPVIKPLKNSFVFEVSTDPAIFLFVNPDVSREKFGNTLAHELHHIGFAHARGVYDATQDTSVSKEVQTVLDWASAFGEGAAMLAAAGGPGIHPHAVSPADERARWDRDMMNFGTDLKRVEHFFTSILDRSLAASAIQDTGSSFFGIQGPWYTVGWKMDSLIESTFGRKTLIECFCNSGMLLETYNRAAMLHNAHESDKLALWDASFLARLARH